MIFVRFWDFYFYYDRMTLRLPLKTFNQRNPWGSLLAYQFSVNSVFSVDLCVMNFNELTQRNTEVPQRATEVISYYLIYNLISQAFHK